MIGFSLARTYRGRKPFPAPSMLASCLANALSWFDKLQGSLGIPGNPPATRIPPHKPVPDGGHRTAMRGAARPATPPVPRNPRDLQIHHHVRTDMVSRSPAGCLVAVHTRIIPARTTTNGPHLFRVDAISPHIMISNGCGAP